jgi:hypothetical protein
VATPVRPATSEAELEPAPPEDIIYIAFSKGVIPERTRDGREWDAVGGNLPDPFAILFQGDQELLRTPVQANTLKPTWPDAVKANYRIPPRTPLRLELWDSNTLTHRPICLYYINDIHQQAQYGFMDIECDSGARIVLTVKPAQPVLGLGLYYELRAQSVFVTRVLEESPASRVGLHRGVEIVGIQGEGIAGKDSAEIRSLLNAHARTGINLAIRTEDGQHQTVSLKEGPIYPLASEGVELQ